MCGTPQIATVAGGGLGRTWPVDAGSAPGAAGGVRVVAASSRRPRPEGGCMRDGEGSAHPAHGPGERPVALLALAPTQRRRAREDVLVDAGFDVRHAPRDDTGGDTGGAVKRSVGETAAGGLAVPTAAGPGALVL